MVSQWRSLLGQDNSCSAGATRWFGVALCRRELRCAVASSSDRDGPVLWQTWELDMEDRVRLRDPLQRYGLGECQDELGELVWRLEHGVVAGEEPVDGAAVGLCLVGDRAEGRLGWVSVAVRGDVTAGEPSAARG